LARAHAVVGRARTTAIVSEAHAGYWRTLLPMMPSDNLVVQPANRGTAIGLLLPALRILERDPEARLLILPSDHYVEDERTLAVAARMALRQVRGSRCVGVVLLGIEADDADPGLGYVVPGEARGPCRAIERFVEKPAPDEARQLCRRGALWNSFIIACRARSLLDLYLARCPAVVGALRAIDLHDDAAVARVYDGLPSLDFSRDIVVGQEDRFAVMPVPHCGWSDLGTPQRLAQTLERHLARPVAAGAASSTGECPVILAARLVRARREAVVDSVATHG
jgi:mannose-1-phosphate guanylyltransferase